MIYTIYIVCIIYNNIKKEGKKMLHNLKIEPKYFKQIKDNTKRYEIRLNDRDYKVGDIN